MDVDDHEIPVLKNIDVDLLRQIGLENKKHAKPTHSYETFTMKKSYPAMIQYFLDNRISFTGKYNADRKLILSYCRKHSLIISRIQLETCELNVPGHVDERLHCEAAPLGSASQPPLPHSPLPLCILPSTSPDVLEFPLVQNEQPSPTYSPIPWEDSPAVHDSVLSQDL